MALPLERFIHIRSSIFPVLEDENPENYHDFLYGKSLCLFLQDNLPVYGFNVDRFVNEDWGWWVSIENPIKKFELGIYRLTDTDMADFAIRIDRRKSEYFSLKKFKKVSRLAEMEKLEAAIIDLMSKTDGVEFIKVSDEFPL